jgi:1-aminocyclopropane-1-carboxylate deaminase/D-cysteine desulfhydrase-like pyridoxal-dependent ACC family enzyme
MPPSVLSIDDRTRALRVLDALAVAPFGHYPTPIDQLPRFARALDLPHRIRVKRDDAIPFGFGGNKVRKLRYLVPALTRMGIDTLITCGGVQSNHARATAAAATASGLGCHLVANGDRPSLPTGNARLNVLLGAEIEYVAARTERVPAMERAAERLRAEGRTPAIVPLGASTPQGALGYVAAVGELLDQGPAPDVIVVASSSGGTLAGLQAGVALHGLSTRIVAVSADDPPAEVEAAVRGILRGLGPLLGLEEDALDAAARIEVDDGFVGAGYGIETPASREAQLAAARGEALFVDHTYTAKALAGLVAYCRDGRIPPGADVLFWHTGGQVGLFA